jgi:hypothetical protein
MNFTASAALSRVRVKTSWTSNTPPRAHIRPQARPTRPEPMMLRDFMGAVSGEQ